MPRDQAFAPVGIILLVGITIALAGGALTVVYVDGPREEPVAAGFLVREGDRLEVVKTGGETLETEASVLHIGTPRGTASVPATELPGLGETWTNGQGVCVAGEGPRCLRIAAADQILDVRVVHADYLVYRWEGPSSVDDLHAGSGPWATIDGDEPVEDPGQAFEDVDGDGLYTTGYDILIPDADVHDGTYHVADPWGLVVPASVGPIDDDRVRLSAGENGHVVLRADITSGEEGIEIEAGEGIQAEDLTLTSDDENVVLDAGQGALEIEGTSFDTKDQRVELRGDGALHASKMTFTADQEKVVIDVGGSADLEGARIRASEQISITAGGDVTLRSTLLSAQEDVTIDTVETARVDVEDARIDDADDTAILTPEAATIEGETIEGSVEHP